MKQIIFALMTVLICVNRADARSMLPMETKEKIVKELYLKRLTPLERACYDDWVVQCPQFPDPRKKDEPEPASRIMGNRGTEEARESPREKIDPQYVAAIECRIEVLDVCNVDLIRFIDHIDITPTGPNGIGYK